MNPWWGLLPGLVVSLLGHWRLWSWMKTIRQVEDERFAEARRAFLLGPTRESEVVWAEYDEAFQADQTARMLGGTRPIDSYLKREKAAVDAWHTKPRNRPWVTYESLGLRGRRNP